MLVIFIIVIIIVMFVYSVTIGIIHRELFLPRDIIIVILLFP